jgi:hypothetical protein
MMMPFFSGRNRVTGSAVPFLGARFIAAMNL